jgi:A/G-specific adenine glycosylase
VSQLQQEWGTEEVIAPFRQAVLFASQGLRRELPWIGSEDPWAIFVSEVMLQQTSTARVIEPWGRFMAAYPTPTACARSPLSDVLRLWSGLGFPRRAKSLHEAARLMSEKFDGAVPSTVSELLALPGVGPYTANAVASFAFHHDVAVLDTNVGRVLARGVANRALRTREANDIAARLVPPARSATFNQALLDLGAQFCTRAPRCQQCPVREECRWHREGGDDPAPRSAGVSRPQAAFEGSDRQLRGRIMKLLSEGAVSILELGERLNDVETSRVAPLLEDLVREGLISRRGQRLFLGADEEPSR